MTTALKMSGAEQLRTQLAAAPDELKRHLRSEFRSVAGPIAADMRRRASDSDRIPGAIKIRPQVGIGSVGIIIYVDHRLAPHARALNNKGMAGEFRHPVYGNYQVWRPQKAMPFFEPAVNAGRPAATAAARKAIDDTIRQIRT